MKIESYKDFVKFFGDYPREKNVVYSVSDNGHGKPGYRGKGYQVIIEEDEWENNYLKECMSVVFYSQTGCWDQQFNDNIVDLILNEIAEIDNDFYTKITDDVWFKKNINPDYECAKDLYYDYYYDEDQYFNDIQNGGFDDYFSYIHHLANIFMEELKMDLKDVKYENVSVGEQFENINQDEEVKSYSVDK